AAVLGVRQGAEQAVSAGGATGGVEAAGRREAGAGRAVQPEGGRRREEGPGEGGGPPHRADEGGTEGDPRHVAGEVTSFSRGAERRAAGGPPMPHIAARGGPTPALPSRPARLPRTGEPVPGHSVLTGFGGKGSNQAVLAARLGARVTMISAVGDDDFGRQA